VDAITLDRLLAEMRPLVRGRHLSRPRIAGAHAVSFELSGPRAPTLWLDAGRGTAGIYLLPRSRSRRLAGGAEAHAPGRTRQALLLLRRHLDGARLAHIGRVPGERTLILDMGAAVLVLRLSGPAPALTLAREGEGLATLGDGPPAWPPPPPASEREWDTLPPAVFEKAAGAALAAGRSRPRAVLGACPGLGPVLARELDGSAASFTALRARLQAPFPTLLVPGPPESWHDADLVTSDAVSLVPLPLEREGRTILHPASWREAAALLLEARRRGLAFEERRRQALEKTRRSLRRLEKLEANLSHDLAGLADEHQLRHEAEALLAFGRELQAGHTEGVVPDPRDPEARLRVALDPRLGGIANAERRFEKARRIERARREIALRQRETRSALTAGRSCEARLLEARDIQDLADPQRDEAKDREGAKAGPLHYLGRHGLSLLVGRNAKENHHLTFRVARPEDLWFHARDAPGAHVILRDPEGRAGAEDLREAAEVAAFFSEARSAPQVDVHVTRRKHVRPAKGGPGRVFVAHSETLRVVPRDPEGHLRRR